MNDYDIRSIFEEIELELIASMRRNLSRHQKWENDEGINWSMWQAEQLKTLENFKKENKKIFTKKFSSVNAEIANFLTDTYKVSGFDQERAILNEIAKGNIVNQKHEKGLEGGFFSLNEDKMHALIKATTNDMTKAEHAMLRMVNDQYRKTIFKAQVMSNSGAFTLQQSIDAATRDFLKSGINCIQYKDGRRVNIASYAEMYIRTSTKRAKLVSEGDVRKAYGIHTVRISKYGQCSETCLPWQGKVYVDDVWSGGTKEEAEEKNLTLLSEAIAGGLFHPNCKHTMTTHFYELKKSLGKLQDDGIENPPEEQEHRKNQLHIQQQKRLETGSLDQQNIQEAKVRKEQWIEKDRKLGYDQTIVSTYREALTIEEAQEIASQYIENRFMDKTFKGVADYKGISIENANKINKALADIYDSLDISKISGIKVVSPTSKHGKKAFKHGADAIASYDPIQNGIFLNKDILKNDKAFKEYIKKSDDAWDTVMSNMDKLSDSQREIALRYKKVGRSLVNGDTVEGVIKHEMGHHIQWDVLDTKTNNMIGSKMSEYAPKISGYANSTKGEYIAESFSAYMKGERDIIDPDFVEFLDDLYLNSDVKYGIINIEIDELTPCLRRLNDNTYVETKFIVGTPSKKVLKDWEFDWSIEEDKGFKVSQLYANGDKRIQGLIATKVRKDLLAIEVDLVESAPFNNPHHKNFVKKEYSGVGGHLFAEAIRQSYEAGYDGYVTFTAKTSLVEYYKNELGATQIGNTQKMYIDERSAKKLYERYFKNK